MPGPRIRYKSSLPYYAALFATLMVWVFVAMDLSQRFISTINSNPLNWVIISSGVFLIPLIPASIVTHNLKNTVELESPSWSFQIREIAYPEFETMMKDYLREYVHLISRVRETDIIFLMILFGICISFPFLLPYEIFFIVLAPYVFAAGVLLFGLLSSRILYCLFENDATSEFPYWHPRKFKKAVDLLYSTPAISYAGVRVAIGEAGGYFTIRDPVATGRIEGIEALARIDVVADKKGGISEATAFLDLDTANESKSKTSQFNRNDDGASLLALVRWLLQEYMSVSESSDILADVLDDVGLSAP